ncbi:MAG TPA: hypothetical protein ENN97_08740 [Phycisphaerales bacterium]|nr:hypothetical protein [Phycisphaerales bacterium]
MVILAGIDEAGYGPLLGPLVVSVAALEMPERLLRADLWELLGKAVAKEKKHLKGRLLITDSKKAYTPSSGLTHLRRTVLSCLAASNQDGPPPETAGQLLCRLCPDAASRLTAYPWHHNLDRIPLADNPQAVRVAASVLDKTLAEHEIRLHTLAARCLDVGFYNQRVAAVRNKSRVLFGELCGLISDLVRGGGPDSFQFIIDRQGGRVRYEQELLRMFPQACLAVIRQDEKMSSYEMGIHNKQIRLHFAAGADGRFLPVCLASMLSKYIREVVMQSQNAYFLDLCQSLKPTAGYWQDGQRFIRDLSEKLPDFTFESQQLIRSL